LSHLNEVVKVGVFWFTKAIYPPWKRSIRYFPADRPAADQV